jgi:hypothetical protein
MHSSDEQTQRQLRKAKLTSPQAIEESYCSVETDGITEIVRLLSRIPMYLHCLMWDIFLAGSS